MSCLEEGCCCFMQFCWKTRRINDWVVVQHSIRIRSDYIISWQVTSGLCALVCSHVKLLWRLRGCRLRLSSFLTSYSGGCYNMACSVIMYWAISYKYLFSLRRPGRHKQKKVRSWEGISCGLKSWINQCLTLGHKGITIGAVLITLCLVCSWLLVSQAPLWGLDWQREWCWEPRYRE